MAASSEQFVTNTLSEENIEEANKLENVYCAALAYYKQQEASRTVVIPAEVKVQLGAYVRQVAKGPYSNLLLSQKMALMDTMERAERQAWMALGDMTAETAMNTFIENIRGLMPAFDTYLQSNRADGSGFSTRSDSYGWLSAMSNAGEMTSKLISRVLSVRSMSLTKFLPFFAGEENIASTEQLTADEDSNITERLSQDSLDFESKVRIALNQQMSRQFRLFAEQQYPNSAEEQAAYIQQLQEQHFEEYMSHTYRLLRLHQWQQFRQQHDTESPLPQKQLPALPSEASEVVEYKSETNSQGNETNVSAKLSDEGDVVGDAAAVDDVQNGSLTATNAAAAAIEQIDITTDEGLAKVDNVLKLMLPELPLLMPASLWTRRDIKAFKDAVRKDPHGSVKVSSLSSVTVRVPTHPGAGGVCWEFATDYYDIGFGVYFEWTTTPGTHVTVETHESSDEEEEPEEVEEIRNAGRGDIERGRKAETADQSTDEIIPTYRRDCHEEVYCGSHAYPGQGVYLLKFDNSYSLWRSKRVYYRVGYTK